MIYNMLKRPTDAVVKRDETIIINNTRKEV